MTHEGEKLSPAVYWRVRAWPGVQQPSFCSLSPSISSIPAVSSQGPCSVWVYLIGRDSAVLHTPIRAHAGCPTAPLDTPALTTLETWHPTLHPPSLDLPSKIASILGEHTLVTWYKSNRRSVIQHIWGILDYWLLISLWKTFFCRSNFHDK